MVEIVLDAETLRLLTVFDRVTGTRVKDVLEEPDRVTFVVESKDLGRAIGKGAIHLKRLREILGKDVELFGYSEDPVQFVRNLFHRFEIQDVALESRPDGKSAARVRLDPKDKGRAIGKGGRNVSLARTLAQRHHGLADVALE